MKFSHSMESIREKPEKVDGVATPKDHVTVDFRKWKANHKKKTLIVFVNNEILLKITRLDGSQVSLTYDKS